MLVFNIFIDESPKYLNHDKGRSRWIDSVCESQGPGEPDKELVRFDHEQGYIDLHKISTKLRENLGDIVLLRYYMADHNTFESKVFLTEYNSRLYSMRSGLTAVSNNGIVLSFDPDDTEDVILDYIEGDKEPQGEPG